MKIYISGKITGIEDEARVLFEQAENELLAEGHEPVNPMKLNHEHDKRWESYMKTDIKALCDCDAIYKLPNWRDSVGATIEGFIAKLLKIPVYEKK